MTELRATPVVKNKFWIVERDGEKIATIQALDEGEGVVWVEGSERQKYPTIKILKDKYNIEFVKYSKAKTGVDHEIYGFPTVGKPHNALYNLALRLPIYSKEVKSKSFYCAGYYLVKINHNWTRAYCPKLITLQRYDFAGPFRSKEDQEQALKEKNGI
jgi:hypothetical protein